MMATASVAGQLRLHGVPMNIEVYDGTDWVPVGSNIEMSKNLIAVINWARTKMAEITKDDVTLSAAVAEWAGGEDLAQLEVIARLRLP